MNQSASRAELLAKAAKMKKPKAKFAFGKHNGRTLEWVADNDPQYIVWVHDNVARSYWPEGFLEVYREAQFAIEDDGEEDVRDSWAREVADE